MMNLASTGAWPQAVVARIFPHWQARRAAKRLFIPPPVPRRAWELRAESSATRTQIPCGLSLLRWHSGNADSRGNILLVHGWGSRAAQMAGFVPQLLEQGFTVYALDAPAHGHSSGDECAPHGHAQAILEAIAALGGVQGLVAHASGAMAAALAIRHGAQIPALVLLATPHSLQRLLQQQLESMAWPQRLQTYFYQALEQNLGEALSRYDTAWALARHTQRLLLVHDQDDEECSAQNLSLLSQALPAAEVWLTHGLGHRKLMRSVEVQHRVSRFLAATNQQQSCVSALHRRRGVA